MSFWIPITLILLAAGGERPDPIDAYIAGSRGELKNAGLTRTSNDQGSVYWIGGPSDAQTVVLLHGANDQAGTWAQVVRALMRDYQLIVPDLAGHGESEPKSGPITFRQTLDQLHEIIDRETNGKVIVAGNSMGGWVAMLYALEHPDKVERLVLEDSSGIAWDMTGVPLRPTNREEAAAMMRAVHGPDVRVSDEMLDAFLARKSLPMSRIALADYVQNLLDARLKDLTVKVSLVWGQHDGILSLAYAKALHHKIPGSTLSIIEGAAHIPHRQKPETFVQCLKASC
ncbi:MAG TPA: alpha/beta hydrolase [Thermoanaerobaculia bacterium]